MLTELAPLRPRCAATCLADVAVCELNLGGFDLPSMMLRDDPRWRAIR